MKLLTMLILLCLSNNVYALAPATELVTYNFSRSISESNSELSASSEDVEDMSNFEITESSSTDSDLYSDYSVVFLSYSEEDPMDAGSDSDVGIREAEFYLSSALNYYRYGKIQIARDFIDRSLQCEETGLAYLYLGYIYLIQGDNVMAADSIERALFLDYGLRNKIRVSVRYQDVILSLEERFDINFPASTYIDDNENQIQFEDNMELGDDYLFEGEYYNALIIYLQSLVEVDPLSLPIVAERIVLALQASCIQLPIDYVQMYKTCVADQYNHKDLLERVRNAFNAESHVNQDVLILQESNEYKKAVIKIRGMKLLASSA